MWGAGEPYRFYHYIKSPFAISDLTPEPPHEYVPFTPPKVGETSICLHNRSRRCEPLGYENMDFLFAHNRSLSYTDASDRLGRIWVKNAYLGAGEAMKK